MYRVIWGLVWGWWERAWRSGGCGYQWKPGCEARWYSVSGADGGGGSFLLLSHHHSLLFKSLVFPAAESHAGLKCHEAEVLRWFPQSSQSSLPFWNPTELYQGQDGGYFYKKKTKQNMWTSRKGVLKRWFPTGSSRFPWEFVRHAESCSPPPPQSYCIRNSRRGPSSVALN